MVEQLGDAGVRCRGGSPAQGGPRWLWDGLRAAARKQHRPGLACIHAGRFRARMEPTHAGSAGGGTRSRLGAGGSRVRCCRRSRQSFLALHFVDRAQGSLADRRGQGAGHGAFGCVEMTTGGLDCAPVVQGGAGWASYPREDAGRWAAGEEWVS